MDVEGSVREFGLGGVLERYRQSIMIELSFAVTGLLIGTFALVAGDDVGRAIGGVFFALGLVTATAAWVKSRRHLYLCTGGLLTTDGSKVTNAVAWDDVASIRVWVTRMYNLPPEDLQRCVLHLRNGKRLNLARPPYAHAERLAERIEQQVVKLAYPRRLAELDETGVTEFGPISVTADGVCDRDRMAVWEEITGMRRGRVRLRVWAAAERRPVISRQVRTIPDVTVLTTFIEERTRG